MVPMFIVVILVFFSIAAGFVGGFAFHRALTKPAPKLVVPEAPATGQVTPEITAGRYVEMGCRSCSKTNRVPVNRLLDRPVCGNCKKRLMPKGSITWCTMTVKTTNIDDNALRRRVDAAWNDEQRLWKAIHDEAISDNRTPVRTIIRPEWN